MSLKELMESVKAQGKPLEDGKPEEEATLEDIIDDEPLADIEEEDWEDFFDEEEADALSGEENWRYEEFYYQILQDVTSWLRHEEEYSEEEWEIAWRKEVEEVYEAIWLMGYLSERAHRLGINVLWEFDYKSRDKDGQVPMADYLKAMLPMNVANEYDSYLEEKQKEEDKRLAPVYGRRCRNFVRKIHRYVFRQKHLLGKKSIK